MENFDARYASVVTNASDLEGRADAGIGIGIGGLDHWRTGERKSA
jgi:hypothetical protein